MRLESARKPYECDTKSDTGVRKAYTPSRACKDGTYPIGRVPSLSKFSLSQMRLESGVVTIDRHVTIAINGGQLGTL